MKGEEFTVKGNEWNAFIYLTWNFLDYTFAIRLQSAGTWGEEMLFNMGLWEMRIH